MFPALLSVFRSLVLQQHRQLSLINKPTESQLYGQLSNVGRFDLSIDIPVSYESALQYRKEKGKYLRKNQWDNPKITVILSF